MTAHKSYQVTDILSTLHQVWIGKANAVIKGHGCHTGSSNQSPPAFVNAPILRPQRHVRPNPTVNEDDYGKKAWQLCRRSVEIQFQKICTRVAFVSDVGFYLDICHSRNAVYNRSIYQFRKRLRLILRRSLRDKAGRERKRDDENYKSSNQ